MIDVFLSLWASQESVAEAWADLQKEADEARDLEREAAESIQRLFRGERIRAWVAVMRRACIEVQRVYRGHVGRVAAAGRAKTWIDLEAVAVFHYYATECQRTFRGYYSRRYRHDFAARKAYIASVVTKGNDLREKLRKQLLDQEMAEREAAEARQRQEFLHITQHLHHLVSTKTIPGVYNSPYDADAPICAMGVPVETHLCSGVKDLLKLRNYAAVPLTVDLNGTRRLQVDYDGAEQRRSLQASSPYDAPLDAARMEAKLGRVGFVGAADMRAGQRVHYPPYRRGVNEGSSYFDPWKNPFMQRGIPRSKQDLELSHSTLGKSPAVPFYTAVGGNRSTVYPNDLFETILAAETTGGVTRRHLAVKAGKMTLAGDKIHSTNNTRLTLAGSSPTTREETSNLFFDHIEEPTLASA